MRYFFADPEELSRGEAFIRGGEARHILNVLRMENGSLLLCGDGQGRLYRARITQVGKDEVRLKIESRSCVYSEPRLEVVLLQGLPKAGKLDFVIQKATEVGAYKIVPLAAERSVVQISSEKAELRCKRWQRIAREAAKQSRRAVVPEVTNIMTLPEALKMAVTCKNSLSMVLWEEEGRNSLKKVIKKSTLEKIERVNVFIGPEGGWTPYEIDLMKGKGIIPVSLGPRILRTETAGIIAVSLILYEWDDLGGPDEE